MKLSIWWNEVDKIDNKTWVCRFCKQRKTGGPDRVRAHLIHDESNKDVASCKSIPDEERDKYKKMASEMDAAKARKAKKLFGSSPILEGGTSSSRERAPNMGTSVSDVHPSPASGSNTLQSYFKRPASSCSLVISTSHISKKFKQQDMVAMLDKSKKKEVDAAFCRAFYTSHIPFRIIECPYFQEALSKAIAYGPAYRLPNRKQVAGAFLKEEKERLGEELLRNARKRYGATIIGDGWTDGRSRCVQGIVVYSAGKVYFLKSYDVSLGKKAEDIVTIWKEAVEFVGLENVIQFVGDGENTNRCAGRMLQDQYPHICFSPCIAHCINNMMKDIGNLDWCAPVIEKARKIVVFVSSHTKTLAMFRRISKKKDLVKFCDTRFGYNFLMLERLIECKDCIRHLFTDPSFLHLPEARFDTGLEAISITFDESFWNDAKHLGCIGARMTKLLRLVDGLEPCIGKVYEGLDRMSAYIQSIEKDSTQIGDLEEICTSRWTAYHSDMHCAAFVLDPEFHDSKQEKDNEEFFKAGLIH